MSGTIMAIGGGLRLDGPVLAEFYRRSGGEDGEIVILPSASPLADSGKDAAHALAALGLRHPARILPVYDHKDASNPLFCAAVANATGVFITGGDQARLIAAIRGTPLHHALRNLLRLGGTVAGTAAGAAALSDVMILLGKGGTHPSEDIAKIDCGLGLIDTCIFDQHFRQRKRIGRLMYAVTRFPNLLGIGIDEDTCAVIEESSLLVVGSGAVTIVDGAAMTTGSGGNTQSSGALIELSGLQLHILTHGSSFDLWARRSNTLGLRLPAPGIALKLGSAPALS